MNSGQIHVTRWGSEGPRVVFVHGSAQGSKIGGDAHFTAQRALAEKGWQLLIPDRPGHGGMLTNLARVLADPAWQAIDLKRQELHRAAPDLVFRLTPVVKRDGNLIIRERVRDHAAEEQRRQSYERAKAIYKALPKPMQAERRREGLVPELDDRPLYRDVEENLGPVRGKHAITDDSDVRSYAITLRGLEPVMNSRRY